AGAHATLFVTHPSPALDSWRTATGLELGWHPNFRPGSTQGKSPAEVAAYLEAIAPGARSMRTHDLHQSTSLFREFLGHARSLRYDSSQYVPGQDHLRSFDLGLGGSRSIKRFPFLWEDDLHLAAGGTAAFRFSRLTAGGLRILNFHPIHIYLNTADFADYERVRALGPMHALTAAQIGPHRNSGRGIATLFADALANLDFSLNLEEFAAHEAAEGRSGGLPGFGGPVA